MSIITVMHSRSYCKWSITSARFHCAVDAWFFLLHEASLIIWITEYRANLHKEPLTALQSDVLQQTLLQLPFLTAIPSAMQGSNGAQRFSHFSQYLQEHVWIVHRLRQYRHSPLFYSSNPPSVVISSIVKIMRKKMLQTNKQTNSMVWVRDWTIPTERPPLLGEVVANFCG
jgi:hypothetical protein